MRQVVPESSRGGGGVLLAVLLHAVVSIEETSQLAPIIIILDGRDGVDFGLEPYLSGYNRRQPELPLDGSVAGGRSLGH